MKLALEAGILTLDPSKVLPELHNLFETKLVISV